MAYIAGVGTTRFGQHPGSTALGLMADAARLAMEDAGLGQKFPAGQEHRWGSYIGAGLGGVKTIEATYTAQHEKGPRHGFSPYFVTDIIINELPGMVGTPSLCRTKTITCVVMSDSVGTLFVASIALDASKQRSRDHIA
jgi:3-oxoacyl-(acyl-carrier-protein) synthase